MDLSNLILLATETAVEHATEESSLLGTFGINWKLFLAQLINFSIILFILWRWVFRPVSGALESRRQKIEESVAHAEEIEKRMQESQEIREQKLREAAAEAESIIKQTSAAAEKSKQDTLLAARTEGGQVLAQARQTIAAEKHQMFKEIREEVANLVVMSTEKIIREKLDEKKDRELINSVLKDLSS